MDEDFEVEEVGRGGDGEGGESEAMTATAVVWGGMTEGESVVTGRAISISGKCSKGVVGQAATLRRFRQLDGRSTHSGSVREQGTLRRMMMMSSSVGGKRRQ